MSEPGLNERLREASRNIPMPRSIPLIENDTAARQEIAPEMAVEPQEPQQVVESPVVKPTAVPVTRYRKNQPIVNRSADVAMERKIAEQALVDVYLPVPAHIKKALALKRNHAYFVPVCINGVYYNLKAGVVNRVPEEIYRILLRSTIEVNPIFPGDETEIPDFTNSEFNKLNANGEPEIYNVPPSQTLKNGVRRSGMR